MTGVHPINYFAEKLSSTRLRLLRERRINVHFLATGFHFISPCASTNRPFGTLYLHINRRKPIRDKVPICKSIVRNEMEDYDTETIPFEEVTMPIIGMIFGIRLIVRFIRSIMTIYYLWNRPK